MDWIDLLVIQVILQSFIQHKKSLLPTSVESHLLWCSAEWSDFIRVFQSLLPDMWKMDYSAAKGENKKYIGIFLVKNDGDLEDGHIKMDEYVQIYCKVRKVKIIWIWGSEEMGLKGEITIARILYLFRIMLGRAI